MEIADNLGKHVYSLSKNIGPRNYPRKSALARAANYIKYFFSKYSFEPQSHLYRIAEINADFENVIAEKPGKDGSGIIIAGAHYDSFPDSPGADDNASAVAVLLELARELSPLPLKKTLRFAAFANEEPPFFKTEGMGSLQYARLCRKAGENIEAMICLESVGCFSDEKGSQSYPFPLKYFYPETGNFISAVSDIPSRKLLKECARHFRRASSLPLETLSAPPALVPQISLSDHWSFWKTGYRAVMITDTAFLRAPHYHTPQDTPEKLDYRRMASVFRGTANILKNLCLKPK